MLFSGRFKGVLARARGTWAGVVLGHRTAVLEVMPQVGQPRCGIVSKSTVLSSIANQLIFFCAASNPHTAVANLGAGLGQQPRPPSQAFPQNEIA